jgi:hypothetical protein
VHYIQYKELQNEKTGSKVSTERDYRYCLCLAFCAGDDIPGLFKTADALSQPIESIKSIK